MRRFLIRRALLYNIAFRPRFLFWPAPQGLNQAAGDYNLLLANRCRWALRRRQPVTPEWLIRLPRLLRPQHLISIPTAALKVLIRKRISSCWGFRIDQCKFLAYLGARSGGKNIENIQSSPLRSCCLSEFGRRSRSQGRRTTIDELRRASSQCRQSSRTQYRCPN